MNALVVATLVFFAAWISVFVARSNVASVRTPLVWLGPVATAVAAAGLYYLYEASATSSTLPNAGSSFSGGAMAPVPSRELNEIAAQLANKLGQDAPPAPEEPKRDAGDLRELSMRLAEKLERDPQNGPGWTLLARTYANTGQFSEAEQVFAKAAKLQPNDAALFADWADTYLIAHERKWDPRAAELVKQALALDPKLPKALALAGTEAQVRGDYKQAADYWARLQAVALPGSADARQAEANLMDVKARIAGTGSGSPRQ
jgi:cytochrome c-type biogenesis protein CcmH/NrfG